MSTKTSLTPSPPARGDRPLVAVVVGERGRRLVVSTTCLTKSSVPRTKTPPWAVRRVVRAPRAPASVGRGCVDDEQLVPSPYASSRTVSPAPAPPSASRAWSWSSVAAGGRLVGDDRGQAARRGVAVDGRRRSPRRRPSRRAPRRRRRRQGLLDLVDHLGRRGSQASCFLSVSSPATTPGPEVADLDGERPWTPAGAWRWRWRCPWWPAASPAVGAVDVEDQGVVLGPEPTPRPRPGIAASDLVEAGLRQVGRRRRTRPRRRRRRTPSRRRSRSRGRRVGAVLRAAANDSDARDRARPFVSSAALTVFSGPRTRTLPRTAKATVALQEAGDDGDLAAGVRLGRLRAAELPATTQAFAAAASFTATRSDGAVVGRLPEVGAIEVGRPRSGRRRRRRQPT